MITAELLDSFDGRPLAVETRALSRRFGKQLALDGLDLRVPESAFYLLVGPNGAGKTTALSCLMDLVPADSGEISVCGLPVPERGPAVRAQIGLVPDDPKVSYGALLVGRLIEHHRRYYVGWDQDYAERLIRELEVPLDQRFGKLSKGQARRAQLVMALAHRPPLLLLDEPTDGLDPLARDRFISLLAEHLAETPTTVVVSTHLPYEVEGLADHLGVLRQGRLIAQLERHRLESHLHHFRVQVPDGWAAPLELRASLIRRQDRGRELGWTLWGDSGELSRSFTAAGATIQSIDRPTLDQACRALLAMEEH